MFLECTETLIIKFTSNIIYTSVPSRFEMGGQQSVAENADEVHTPEKQDRRKRRRSNSTSKSEEEKERIEEENLHTPKK